MGIAKVFMERSHSHRAGPFLWIIAASIGSANFDFYLEALLSGTLTEY
jgi:hypothetical protein